MNFEKIKKDLIDWLKAVVWALLVFLFIVKPFLLSGYKIPSGSMKDTLLVGDYLMVDKFTYGGKIPLTNIRVPGFRKPKVGDIVVFWDPSGPMPTFWDKLFFWRKEKNIRLIKRCVAVGGQTVEVRDKQLYVDGKRVVEPYIKHIDPIMLPGDVSPRDNFGPITVPKGAYFMMGDNRDNSKDSRFIGVVTFDRVIGTPRLIYFSFDNIRKKIRFNRILKVFYNGSENK